MSSSRIALLAAAAAASLVAAAPASAAAPVVDQMVVFKNGSAKTGKVRAHSTRVKVGRERCRVGSGTPLAALIRSRVGRLRIEDYGSCGSRARDAGGLYVRGIRRDVTRPGRPDGWVYKVGNKAAPAGAGDPAGPFGRGPLRRRQPVLWFWCITEEDGDGCQRTLHLKVTGRSSGTVTVLVRGYDNSGRGIPVEGARVTTRGASALTGPDGTATIATGSGRHTLVAKKTGLVRSFPVKVGVP